jgi:glycosyltransferase involved in cell wall biosynthesis
VARDYSITLVVLFGDRPHDRGPLSSVDWIAAAADAPGRVLAAASLVAQGLPPYLRHFATARQRRVVAALLDGAEYDAVVADTPFSAATLPPESLSAARGVGGPADALRQVLPPLIVNTHNVESEVWKAVTAEVCGGRLLRFLDRRSIGLWERTVLAAADGAAFCSERDQRLFEGTLASGCARAVVRNAVDVSTIGLLPPPPDQNEVLFVGGLEYGPNRDAARFLVTELAPLLSAEGITVLIAGGDADDLHARWRRLAAVRSGDAGVRFLGRPADLSSVYRRSFACVVPLFAGSGTRLKILEAFARGRPVVSTAKGMEGIAARPGVDFLPAETPQEFAGQVLALRDASSWRQIALAGRDLVERCYSAETAGAAFLDLIRSSRSAS